MKSTEIVVYKKIRANAVSHWEKHKFLQILDLFTYLHIKDKAKY